MDVLCEVNEVELQGDRGMVEGVEVVCGRCGHVTESFGTYDASIRRCLTLLREECPKGERNFYKVEDDESE